MGQHAKIRFKRGAILEFGEISEEQFNIPISELKLPAIKSLKVDTSVGSVLEMMQAYRMGSVLLAENNQLAGIVTEKDLLMKGLNFQGNYLGVGVAEVMTANPKVFTEKNTIADCIKLISHKEFRHIPVVDENGSPKYMISINDILRFIVDCFPNDVKRHGTVLSWDVLEVMAHDENFSFVQKKGMLSGTIFLTPLNRIVRQEALRVDINAGLQGALHAMMKARSGVAVITEYETSIRGIITERDFLLKVFGRVDLTGDLVPIKDYMTPNPDTLLSRHILAHAINNMFARKYRNTILVDEDSYPLAIISLLDVFKYISSAIFQKEEEDEL